MPNQTPHARLANPKIADAVVRNDADRKERLLDRAFARAFRGLVYAQIWEDPVVDMAALEIGPGHRVVSIASGSCNALSYLTADPAAVTAVDLNTAHVAMGQLKIAAVRHLPDHAALRRFFVEADDKANLRAYRDILAPALDETSRRYWEGRDLIGRRRIGGFRKGIYKRGLLGQFIGLAHLLAKLHGLDPAVILEAKSLDEQRRLFDERFAPLFDRRMIRWLTSQPASLFGLGIPPAQYDALAGDQRMAEVLRQRLEKLACAFPIDDNYFAWQAFGRGYGRTPDAPLPPWLEPRHYEALRARIDRLDVRHANMTEHLAGEAAASLDRYVLLDAQDWMSDAQLTALWSEVTRTARPGARVLFRTAAEETLLPGRVPAAILDRWDYNVEQARSLIQADRSSIYGGLHLYRLKP
jgi:S-adenosylmethionine-diacylglycerol 3-amino-3-carboxypropyl transferase